MDLLNDFISVNGNDKELDGEHLTFHEIFCQMVNLMTTVRFAYVNKNKVMMDVASEKLTMNIEVFKEYALATRTKVHANHRAGCEAVDDYEFTVDLMMRISIEQSKMSEMDILPEFHKSMQDVGFTMGSQEEIMSMENMWVHFKRQFVEYIEESKSGRNGEKAQLWRVSAQMFSITITRKLKVTEFKRHITSHEVDLSQLVEGKAELEQNHGVLITWTIDAYMSPRPIVRINWPQVNGMLHNVLTTLLNWNNYDNTKRVVNAFLGWYHIMQGDESSIFSDKIKSWLMIGKIHVRNIATMLSRMPPAISNNGRALKDFLGCRHGVNTWYIGIIDSILAFETDAQIARQFNAYLVDLKKMC